MKKITLIIGLLVSALSFSQELLLNGGFENWDNATSPTNFTKVENIEQEATEKHSGSFSAKHTGGTKNLGQTVNVTPGNYYTISLWYKTAQEGDGTDARIWSYWKNGSTNLNDNADELRGPAASIGNNSGYLLNVETWTKYETTLQAPAEADSFYFEVRTYSGAITYWDDLSVFDHGATLSVKENTIPNLVLAAENGEIVTNKGTITGVYNVMGQQVANENLNSGIYVITVTENNLTSINKVFVK
ncbi:hypothetical protein QVZ41_04200 [Wenyingzhuangia sp. chi5]|uniref:T9SS type A sorting domain-containing protein n=1 Tax=Wenyingzhuangia gilva TaxID=3057677 RepID=A0ABT8VQ28_9FLAO|nr:hypothetical protein [Wenyingzhuangia sp. chi5]MDO3694052.1 hypothetical protein [Wenyingzhuangia sp. chi5]